MKPLASLFLLVITITSCVGESVSLAPVSSPTPVVLRACGEAIRSTQPPGDFHPVGKELRGDVDGDGRRDRVRQYVSPDRPKRCSRLVGVETASGDVMTARIKPVGWPSSDPKLRMLAAIDGRRGLEIVVSLSPAPAVYRPGSVYTVVRKDLALMRVRRERQQIAHLLPFYDEFPAGVDCADDSGEIVETWSIFAPGGDDSVYRVIRTVYRAQGELFVPVTKESQLVDCCDDTVAERWPETRDRPFRTCARIVR